MKRDLEDLDTVVHNPLQTHISSFRGENEPYPGHGENK